MKYNEALLIRLLENPNGPASGSPDVCCTLLSTHWDPSTYTPSHLMGLTGNLYHSLPSKVKVSRVQGITPNSPGNLPCQIIRIPLIFPGAGFTNLTPTCVPFSIWLIEWVVRHAF